LYLRIAMRLFPPDQKDVDLVTGLESNDRLLVTLGESERAPEALSLPALIHCVHVLDLHVEDVLDRALDL